MHLVIVESPTKAKTIRKFLGKDYAVVASMGHVRDLPSSQDEVPEKYKKTDFGRLGVDVANDFEPLYVISPKKAKTVSELKRLLKDADDIYLATDEDREGESISWHLLELLKPKVPVKRMVFHEITKGAIDEALAHPRDIDEKLVRAQETRRILDRLVGYTVSPVIWKKIAFGLSAGRVQSPSLKAIVDRERLRMAFRKGSYWDVVAELEKDKTKFEAKLVLVDGKRIANGKDFDESTGAIKADAKDILLLDEAASKTIADASLKAEWKVTDVTQKETHRKAPPPFTTSTLQQESNRKIGLSSRDTMRTAQSLYEKGFITYMRTDSTNLSAEALKGIRSVVTSRFGEEYIGEARSDKAAAGAQEAHEAIRPSLTFTAPQETGLSGSEHDVYELIWMRAMASQMKDAKQLQISARLSAGTNEFQATGMKILFPGFLRAYVEGADDVEQAIEDREKALPELKTGDKPSCVDTKPLPHETKPPARFTEASIIQFMEKEGIGRPSTYAATISTLLDRGYVAKQGSALIPTFTAFAVTQLLEKYLSDLVDVTFTSTMEKSLDKIAEGTQEWLPYLRGFYLGEKGLQNRIKVEMESTVPDDAKLIHLPDLDGYTIKVGKFGPYVESTLPITGAAVKASLPADMFPGEVTKDAIDTVLKSAQQGPTSLGIDPETGLAIFLRTGSYGPYLQLGEEEEGSKKKPKRASIPKTIPLETLDFNKALSILALPRLLGVKEDSGKDIRAGLGRFGPYIVHDGDFRSIKEPDDVLTISLERALEMLAQPKGTRGGGVGKEIGKHPDDNKPVTLHSGKFGNYVKHGKVNATIPKDMKPEDVTLAKAVELIAERSAKGTTTKPKAKRAPRKKKTPAE
ncbi:type I DNA topoisomerase [Candidatus Uhrbacteria bacterium]|nr:type I DNA topoisomerase [Candidatus Uhrbacteria bacterium]